MKKTITIAVIISLLMCVALLSSCKKGSGSETPKATELRREMEKDSDFEKPEYINEQEGAKLVTVPHSKEEFVGKWSCGSDYAEYLYGNVDLKINKNRSWSGNITEEEFSGKWKYNGTYIILKDSEGIINWNLYYVEDGSLMFTDVNKPDIALTLLKAK